ncbi:rhodanese-like domain-containing protein [Kribbella deserti]|uniref:Rhodanese-like domain-containing protein n=1 Tax=Kribbella deserti TaxID=1926257 RepID=A0ABV6QVH1_9ACTN
MSEIPAITLADLTDEMLADVHVLDVREDDEWARGHIAGAQHIPLGELQARVAEVPKDQRIVCVCAVGGRSGMATQFLNAEGRDVINLDGGMYAWAGAGRPLSFD